MPGVEDDSRNLRPALDEEARKVPNADRRNGLRGKDDATRHRGSERQHKEQSPLPGVVGQESDREKVADGNQVRRNCVQVGLDCRESKAGEQLGQESRRSRGCGSVTKSEDDKDIELPVLRRGEELAPLERSVNHLRRILQQPNHSGLLLLLRQKLGTLGEQRQQDKGDRTAHNSHPPLQQEEDLPSTDLATIDMEHTVRQQAGKRAGKRGRAVPHRQPPSELAARVEGCEVDGNRRAEESLKGAQEVPDRDRAAVVLACRVNHRHRAPEDHVHGHHARSSEALAEIATDHGHRRERDALHSENVVVLVSHKPEVRVQPIRLGVAQIPSVQSGKEVHAEDDGHEVQVEFSPEARHDGGVHVVRGELFRGELVLRSVVLRWARCIVIHSRLRGRHCRVLLELVAAVHRAESRGACRRAAEGD